MSSDAGRSIREAFKQIEAANESNVDRVLLHRQMDELNKNIDGVADPVLKTEYMRKLSVLRGTQPRFST